MPSGAEQGFFVARSNLPPASNPATLVRRNGMWFLAFDQTTDESAIFDGQFKRTFTAAAGVTVEIEVIAVSVTTGNCMFTAAFEVITPGAGDLDADDFAAAQSSSATAISATNGRPVLVSITFTNAQADSPAAGLRYRLKITRDADNAGGGSLIAEDVQVKSVRVKQT